MNYLNVILADATAPAATGAQQQGSPFGLLVPMGLMLVILYFMMIRPQQKRAKEQRKMLDALKSGDKVVTSAGIIGEVITVKEKSVSLRSNDAKLEITKDSIVAITEAKPETKA